MLVIGVAVAALMWAKTAVLEVLAQRERKFVSCSGGWAFLYNAGRCPVWWSSLLKEVCVGVYQARPKPSMLKSLFRAAISCSVVMLSGSWERSLGK